MRENEPDVLRLSDLRWQAGETEPRSAGVTSLDRTLVRLMLKLAGDPPVSIVLWNGETFTPPGVTPRSRIHVASRRAIRQLVMNGELHFGDLYAMGLVEVEGDLVRYFVDLYHALERARRKYPLLRWIARRQPRPNTLARSRENIHHHYDIGNAFYQLWLDSAAMQYTCAYFPDPSITLEEAQIAKLHHVCRKLELRPGQTVVEAGCGWGGLARFMAREYGVTVRAYNISREQVAYAREQAEKEGLSGRVEYVLDDYRNITGVYDRFVSVGMLEHVGVENYRQLGAVVDRCLKPDGRGLIHSIGRNRPGYMNPWIEARIFPGAYPPTLAQMMNIFEPYGMSVLDVENLRMHYARTLSHWLARYEAHAETVKRTFDLPFYRAWRLYLAGSQAAFTAGTLQLFQVVFARSTNNDLPWSRAHLYETGAH